MKKKLSPIDWAFLQSESPERLAHALNITITSHGDCLDFGVLACREAVPDVARIADYLIDA